MAYIGNQPVLQTTQFRDEFFPTSNQTAFTTGGFHPSSVNVYRNGVLLSEDDYVKGSDNVTITLNSAAISGDVVVIRGNRSLAQGVSVSESRVEYTWQSGDTVVQLNADVIPAYTDVYLNGVKLAAADYTINTVNRTVSFTPDPAVGDVIAVVHKNETSALVGLPLKDSSGAAILSESGSTVALANVDTATIGSNALVVNSSGNVGVGINNPSSNVEVSQSETTSTTTLKISNAGSTGLGGAKLSFGHNPNSEIGYIKNNYENYGGGFDWAMTFAAQNQFRFVTDVVGTPTERMRIDSSGRFIVGSTTAVTTNVAGVMLSRVGTQGRIEIGSTSTSAQDLAYFINPNGIVGSIQTSGTSTSYVTSSDYRLKENITEITDGITRVKQLNPSRFNFIADPDKIVDGFIAHEVQDIVPEAITGEKDAVNEDGSIRPQGIDQSKLVPLLTAALQEAIGLIESQQSQIDALTARIAALETPTE